MYHSELPEEIPEGFVVVKLSHTPKEDDESVAYFYLNEQIKHHYLKDDVYYTLMRLITHGGYFLFTDKTEALWFCDLFHRFLTVNSKYKVDIVESKGEKHE